MPAFPNSTLLPSLLACLEGLRTWHHRLAAACARGVVLWHAWRRQEQDARILRDMSERELRDLGLGRGDLPGIARGMPPGDGWR
jgi:uncharacterized protein YjiS (DUF1127 family)